MSKSMPLKHWLRRLEEAFNTGTLVKLELLKPTEKAGKAKGIEARPIMVKRQPVLSITTHNQTQDMVKNYPLEGALAVLQGLIPAQFTHARLHTTAGDFYLACVGPKWLLTDQSAKFTQAPSLSHDAAKNHPLAATNTQPYLHALGLTDAQGVVLKSAQDKFKQINKYIEIVAGLVKQLPAKQPLKIIDMGAGKGYLTFALYHHLTANMGVKAEVIGVEFRADLVALCNSIAAQNNMAGLRFIESSIASYNCTGADVVIALHACDTATDDALLKAVGAGAQLVILAPCCHKQVRRAMAQNTLTQSHHHPLHAALQFGTYAERMADMLTDTLRANTLAQMGYTTNLFEFIGGEHTPKNVMITALKRTKPLSAAEAAKLQTTRAGVEEMFGLSGIILGK